MTQHELTQISNHHRFLKNQMARLQDELRECDAKYCRALLEYRHQGNCDPPLPNPPF